MKAFSLLKNYIFLIYVALQSTFTQTVPIKTAEKSVSIFSMVFPSAFGRFVSLRYRQMRRHYHFSLGSRLYSEEGKNEWEVFSSALRAK